MLSTPACHGPWTDNTAPKYQDKFSDRKAPRDPAFNHYAKVHIQFLILITRSPSMLAFAS